MTIKKHGLSIGIERIGSNGFLFIKAQGKLTHEDYINITPMLDSALNGVTEPKIKVLVDLNELEGWEARAAWDDFKLGLKHGNEFGKIAIYANKKWIEIAAKLGNWFTSGEVTYFEEEQDALAWLED